MSSRSCSDNSSASLFAGSSLVLFRFFAKHEPGSCNGFDYLRDNMAVTVEGWVQRGHHYAIRSRTGGDDGPTWTLAREEDSVAEERENETPK